MADCNVLKAGICYNELQQIGSFKKNEKGCIVHKVMDVQPSLLIISLGIDSVYKGKNQF